MTLTLTQEIQQKLTEISNPQNNLNLKQATKEFQELLKNQQAIGCLFEIIHGGNHKQLAAIELRKLVTRNDSRQWEQLSVNDREILKQRLLENCGNEPQKNIRNTLCHCLSAIARIELANNRWPNLVEILYNACNSDNNIHKEMGITILYNLFELIADRMETFHSQLFELFTKTIMDSNLTVAVITVQCLGKIADFIDEQDMERIIEFQNMIPGIVQVLQRALQEGDEDYCSKIFEVFDELLILEVPVLKKHFVDLLHLFLGISTNTGNSDEIRVQSLSFLMWCIMSAKSKIVKAKLIPSILDAMIIIGKEDIENEDGDSPPGLAIQVINTLSTTLSPNQVIPDLWSRVQKAIESGQSSEKKAAILAVGSVIEGCADYLRPKVEEITNLILTNMRDNDSSVRRASCVALTSMLEEFESELMDMHQQIVPVLYDMITDDENVAPVALNALDTLLENLGPEIEPYVDVLMTKLLSIWGTGPINVRVTTTNCIGSVAHSSGQRFLPYFEECVKRLSEWIYLSEVEYLPLRSVVTDCFGAVATAAGKDLFRPFLNSVMEAAVNGLQLDHTGVKQCSYVLFGVLAKLYEGEFSIYLPIIVPPLLLACEQEESTDWLQEEDDQDSMSGEEPEGIKFASGIAQEKEFSLDTLGELFEATKGDFMPYLAQCINIAMSMFDHYNEGVRTTACLTMFHFFEISYEMSNKNDWNPGLPLSEPLHENVANIGKIAMEGAILMLADEDDR